VFARIVNKRGWGIQGLDSCYYHSLEMMMAWRLELIRWLLAVFS